MDGKSLKQTAEFVWELPPQGKMRVPGRIYASESLIREMEEKVLSQIANVATLPGIVSNSFAMPDAHAGFGFPIGGVAAFDPANGGIISAGGVGYDISCGVRTILTGLPVSALLSLQHELTEALFKAIPTGLGGGGGLHLSIKEIDAMLAGGAQWAVKQGYGLLSDVERIEDEGCIRGAEPGLVSEKAKQRQQSEMGTLGSGNHYLEVQKIVEIFDHQAANAYGLKVGEVVIGIHSGSRGLGHQVATDYIRQMGEAARQHHLTLPDQELACIPAETPVGRAYMGAMRAAMNCALANRQIISHRVRQVFADLFPKAHLPLLYDVSHNTCKEEFHRVNGERRRLLVHRKGATRALAAGHTELPPSLRAVGQPVLIGGSMGTFSYILAGGTTEKTGEEESGGAFTSVCHGAGRRMSRHQAARSWNGRALTQQLEEQGILVRSNSWKGLAEEAPGAYKDVSEVVLVAEKAGLARRVARLAPLLCLKG